MLILRPQKSELKKWLNNIQKCPSITKVNHCGMGGQVVQIQLKSDTHISTLKVNFTAIGAVFLHVSIKSCLIMSNNFNKRSR